MYVVDLTFKIFIPDKSMRYLKFQCHIVFCELIACDCLHLPQRWELIQAVPEGGPVNHLDLHNVVDCFVKGGGLLFETLCLEMRNYWILIESVTFSKLFIHATYLYAISTRSYDV